MAIVNIGFNESSERESNDRPFELPEYQDSLVQCITAAIQYGCVAECGWKCGYVKKDR